MVSRRRVVIALGASALAAPLALFAQQPPRLPRIGYLTLAPLSDSASPERSAFLQGLRELGYIDGKTVTIEYQSGDMNVEMLRSPAGNG